MHTRQIVRVAGLAHPFAEPRLLTELLNNAHSVNHFIKTVVDIRQPRANPPDDGRTVALINHHHDQYCRENSDSHQRHSPVKAEHRHQHRANQSRATQDGSHDGHIEIANHFGIVGHPRDELPDRLGIKLAERLTQGGVHDVAAKLLHHAHRRAVKQQRLAVMQTRGEELQADVGCGQAADQLQRQRVLRYHIVDKVADQQRAAHLRHRRDPHDSNRYR